MTDHDDKLVIKAKREGQCPRCRHPIATGDLIEKGRWGWQPLDCPGCAERRAKNAAEDQQALVDFSNLLQPYYSWMGPETQGKLLVEIYLSCEFEPPGRHETWGPQWTLKLPLVNHYWEGKTGWERGNEGVSKTFAGDTLAGVLREALTFAKQMPEALEWENSIPYRRTHQEAQP